MPFVKLDEWDFNEIIIGRYIREPIPLPKDNNTWPKQLQIRPPDTNHLILCNGSGDDRYIYFYSIISREILI